MTSIVSDVARHYDDLDSYYRQLWGDHLHHGYWQHPGDSIENAVIQLIDQLVQDLNVPAGGKICDVGCGYGSTLRYVAKSKGWDGVGYTISAKQVEYGKAMNEDFPNIDLICEDWSECTLSNESVDGLVAIESTEHIPSFEVFLQQSHRVLKPRSRMAIGAWLRDPGSARFLDKYLNDKIVTEGRLARMLYSDVFCESVAKVFRIVSVRDISKQVRRTWWHCTKRVLGEIVRNPKSRAKLFDRNFENKIFALTVFRILLSYYLGNMRYYILVAEKS